jgi:NADH-quinone oxidoreductase subunit A
VYLSLRLSRYNDREEFISFYPTIYHFFCQPWYRRECQCPYNSILPVHSQGEHLMTDNVPVEYALAAVMLMVAIGLGLLTLALGRVFGPARRPQQKNPPPEYGGRTGHKTWVQFRLRYAVLALLFVSFDMEMVFMFPWAVVFKRGGLVAFFDMFVFVAILSAAIFFAWKEGVFDWEY